MDYSFKPTTHGRAVIAACMSLGRPPDICRVAFGSGRIAEDVNLADVHELLNYVADGTIADRHHKNDHFYFTIQYANSEHKTVPTFYLSEFIVYIRDPETDEEVDLLYGTMGDYILPVPKYHDSIPPSIFDLPLVLIISDDVTVQVTAPPGLVTYADLEAAVAQAMARMASDTNVIPLEIAIPTDGWTDGNEPDDGEGDTTEIGEDAYGGLYRDIQIEGVTEDMIPQLNILPDSLGTAKACELSNSAQTMDGILRVYAKTAPSSEIRALLVLIVPPSIGGGSAGGTSYALPIASETTLGAIKIGSGLSMAPDGTASVDMSSLSQEAVSAIAEQVLPTEDEVNSMLDSEFQPFQSDGEG